MTSRAAAWRAAVFAGLATLAACSSPGACDPTRADLFTGIGCSVGGGYSTRTTDLVSQRDAAEQERLQQIAAEGQADTERAAAEQQLRDRQQRLATLRRQTTDMQRRLDAARQRQGADAAAVAHVQAELTALQQQQTALPAAPSDAEIRAVEQQRQQVLRLINQM
jgi:chromosome segregation ATPase